MSHREELIQLDRHVYVLTENGSENMCAERERERKKKLLSATHLDSLYAYLQTFQRV